jgi:hypothetical protein
MLYNYFVINQENCESQYGKIEEWDVSNVTNMIICLWYT